MTIMAGAERLTKEEAPKKTSSKRGSKAPEQKPEETEE